MPADQDAISDSQIGDAIQDGVNYLMSLMKDGQLNAEALMDAPRVLGGNAQDAGVNGLCLYALLQCGKTIHDERLNVRGAFVREALDHLKQSQMDRGPVTYARAIRAQVLSVYDRPEDRAVLKDDVAYLVKAAREGSYSYSDQVTKRSGTTPTRSMDCLACGRARRWVWKSPTAYWKAVQNHWTRWQLEDGQWTYGPMRSPSRPMTYAGMASMFVTHDYLEAPQFGAQVGRPPFSEPLARAGVAGAGGQLHRRTEPAVCVVWPVFTGARWTGFRIQIFRQA